MSLNAIEQTPSQRNLYVIISQTPSKFARTIRLFTHSEYNHTSIAFDDKLEELYSFGRLQNNIPVVAGLIKEYPARFTLKKKSYVKVKIYKIPITERQYNLGMERLKQIKDDKDGYFYNLFSVLTFPLKHGCKAYKAYTCAEFVAEMLKTMGVRMTRIKPDYAYTPEEIGDSLEGYSYIEGNMLDFCHVKSEDEKFFFEKTNVVTVTYKSSIMLCKLLYRTLGHRKGC